MSPVLLIALACSFLQVVFGGDMPLQKRTCNHDNCLRSLLGHSVQASPFCTAYLNHVVPSTTVPFTTVCTEAPNAVSTACSCLLASTSTTTTTSSTPTATQCAASNNYGFVYEESAYDAKSAVLYFLFPYNYTPLQPGQCCNLCYQTIGCYGFTTGLAQDNTDYMYCELAMIPTNQGPYGPNQSPQCPAGQYYWSDAALGPYVPGSTGGSGQGPCGIF